MTHDDMSASTHQTSLAESRPIGRRIVFKPDYAHGSDCGTKASIDLIQLDYCDERKFTAPRRDTQLKFDAGGGSDTHTLDYIADLRPPCAQYTPPTQLNSTVESRRRRRCVLGFSWVISYSMHGRHYERHVAAISTCHGHVEVSATEPSRLLRCRLEIGCWQNSSNFDRHRHSDKNSRTTELLDRWCVTKLRQYWNWPKRTGGSAAEMFEIFPRNWS